MTLTVGSLFSGIGGIDLGLERAGMTVRWQSEIDPYCSQVLAKHWPTVPNLGDIKQIEWSGVEPVDLIAGGYPCQPFSLAGQRQGADDPRHLWPYMLGAIRHLRPRFAFLENVAGHLSMGFGRVLGDLAESGYDTEWDCIPAVAVGAPHRRDRVFIIAYAQRDELRQQPVAVTGRSGSALVGVVADTNGGGCNGRARYITASNGRGQFEDGGLSLAHANRERLEGTEPFGIGIGVESVSGDSGGSDLARYWTAEPSICRVADGVPSRVDRLRSLGNAVVPQVAEVVGRRILESVTTV